jgi:hypothetical protein
MGIQPAVAVYDINCPFIVTWCLVTTAESTCNTRLLAMGCVFFEAPSGACANVTADIPQMAVIRVSALRMFMRFFK